MLLSARSEERPPRQPWRLAWTVLVVSLLSVMCSEQVPTGAGPGASGSRASEPPRGGAEAAGGGGSQTNAGGSGEAGQNDVVDSGGAPPTPGGTTSGGEAAGGAYVGGAPGGGEPPAGGAPAGGAPAAEKSGLPCDVERVLRVNCQSCHGRTPAEGAVVSLLTRADLAAPSHVIPNISVAARSIQRITNSLSPMPPTPLPELSAADLGILRNWFKLDMPESTCEEEPNPSEDPYEAPEKCSSGSFWPANYESPFWGMMPGRPCLGCHRLYPQHAPIFSVAGTVYPTAHEPDRCYGVPSTTGAKVIITDANGVEQPPLPVVSNGNFGVIIQGLALPYRAKVVVGDTERVMLTPQTNGDCNACHTQVGTQGARGRIILP